MREIKFRVWDKKNNKWLNLDEVESFLEFNCAIGAKEIFLEEIDKWKTDLEIVLYTGLKDKNGKEIYEGDIVRWTIFSDEYLAQIVYSAMAFSFFHPEKGHLYDINFQTIEVIGNIYENPELLQEVESVEPAINQEGRKEVSGSGGERT